MTSSREAVIVGIATELLRTSGGLRLRVFSNSMRPSLRPGDIVTVQSKMPLNIVHGDVVLYGRDGRLFVHRVIGTDWGTGEQVVLTRGDALASPDPPVSGDAVLGRVVGIVRCKHKINLQAGWRALLRPLLSRTGPVLGTCFRLTAEAVRFGRVFLWCRNKPVQQL